METIEQKEYRLIKEANNESFDEINNMINYLKKDTEDFNKPGVYNMSLDETGDTKKLTITIEVFK